MTEEEDSKQYDLEERTFQFAKRVRAFVKRLPRNAESVELMNIFGAIYRKSEPAKATF